MDEVSLTGMNSVSQAEREETSAPPPVAGRNDRSEFLVSIDMADRPEARLRGALSGVNEEVLADIPAAAPAHFRGQITMHVPIGRCRKVSGFECAGLQLVHCARSPGKVSAANDGDHVKHDPGLASGFRRGNRTGPG